ncbi:probable calcium-binding protein CML25, partial [Nilaparvata lugens]|uniref:probable calcium-binding protein CML25 n=1 Tax=Nilaparvata lugens TaxID=108931 RepID=UPI00193CFC58
MDSEKVKGWTAVFQLFDTNGDGYITETDMDKFFQESEYASSFEESARANIYKLIRENDGKVNLDKFLSVVGSWKITTLKALQDAFPDQTSVSGEDLNRELKLDNNGLKFQPNKYYELE